jgi:thiol-disulfide isomerase/thioredoxin
MIEKVFVLTVCLAGAGFAGDVKPAPQLALKDASGKTVTLEKYHGKVVLIDFWATWCTGCKEEMPWFVEYQKEFGTKKFAVIGVAMDDEGWKVVAPFLKSHKQFRYKMVVGDQATADRFGWGSMLPDSFLIDQRGYLVEAYHGKVDRAATEARIAELLGRR